METYARSVGETVRSAILDRTSAWSAQRTQNFNKMALAYAQQASFWTRILKLVWHVMNLVRLVTMAIHASLAKMV